MKSSLTTNWEVERYIASRIANGGKLSIRDEIYRALASPGSSAGALLVAIILQTFSVASVVISAYQLDREAIEVELGNTCPKRDPMDPDSACLMTPLSFFNWIFGVIFAIELIVRVGVYKDPHRNWTVWLDAFTIAPMLMRAMMAFYGIRPLEIEDEWMRMFTILVCSFTPLRLLKLGRYMSGIQLLMGSLKESVSALIIPLYMLVVLFTFFGTLVYAAEYDPTMWNEGGRIQTISDAYWMVLVSRRLAPTASKHLAVARPPRPPSLCPVVQAPWVTPSPLLPSTPTLFNFPFCYSLTPCTARAQVTMTTVGYGDYSPKTATGRIIIGFVMLFGLCFLAMPLAIVGNTFSEAWDQSTAVTISEGMRKKMLMAGQDPSDMMSAFKSMDKDGNGQISYLEFKDTVLRLLDIRMDKAKLRKVWKSLDNDESDSVAYREFCSIFFPDADIDVLAVTSASQQGGMGGPSDNSEAPSGVGGRDLAHIDARVGAIESALAGQNAMATMLQQALTAQEQQRRAALAQQTELQQTITHLLDSRLNSVEAGVAGQNSLANLLKDSLSAQEEMRQQLVMQQAEQQQLVKQLVGTLDVINSGHGAGVTQALMLKDPESPN